MPDWKKLIEERLESARLPAASREEIVAELAGHLEETCDRALSQGFDEADALAVALQEVDDWRVLAADICRAKQEDHMENRTRALWLPAIVNLTVAAALLIILEKLGIDTRMTKACDSALTQMAMHHLDHINYFVFMYKILYAIHLSWLLTLPLSAAAGCLMARRAQASAAERLIVGLAPSLLWLAVFVVMVFVFELDRWQFPAGFPLEFGYFAFAVVAWTVLPALPLLLGTLPFLRESSSLESGRPTLGA